MEKIIAFSVTSSCDYVHASLTCEFLSQVKAVVLYGFGILIFYKVEKFCPLA